MYGVVILLIFTVSAYRVIILSRSKIVLRDFGFLLYVINYLVSPYILYFKDAAQLKYPMKLDFYTYFNLAIPMILAFGIGLNLLKMGNTEMPNFNKSTVFILKNEQILRLSMLILAFLPFANLSFGSFDFLIYLISDLRFIISMSLLTVGGKVNFVLVLGVFSLKLIESVIGGMFHDFLLWVIFLGIFCFYNYRISVPFKLGIVLILSIIVYIIQSIKQDYRAATWGDTNLQSDKSEIFFEKSIAVNSSSDLFSDQNLDILTRINQGWIFASTVDNMDRNREFQGLNLISVYIEAALLPRFLAPNKLKSGVVDIFNKYSGHYLAKGTSMGLGVFAEGYVAFGTYGAILFGFVFGFLINFIMFLINKWASINVLYTLFQFIMLSYAVRPDCELHTALNHILKSYIFFWILVTISKYKFRL